MPTRSLRIGMLHPELALGGSERLVVDAARTLQAAGHRVTLFTTRHDPLRRFEETANGAIDIRVCSPPWPSHIGQGLRAPCTIIRMAWLAATALAQSHPFDIVFCDLVAHIIPLVKRLTPAKVIFYCHFPDQLLTRQGGTYYRLYRQPIDRLEAAGMNLADAVLVNSRFTAACVERTFPKLRAQSVHVVHPGVDSARYPADGDSPYMEDREIVVLSLNRFVPEKNHALAIRALSLVRERLPAHVFTSTRLVIAGGFDAGYREYPQTLRQLRELAGELDLTEHVTFLPSCPESDRLRLLAQCRCILYTPTDEHFGFGPLEAMAAGRPVVAVASGGPLETVRHEETGLLCPPTPDAFAAAMARLILNRAEAAQMGTAGRRHVAERFSLSVFGARMGAVLDTLAPTAPAQ